MRSAESPLVLKTDEETQVAEPIKRPHFPNVALIAGTAIVLFIIVIAALTLSLNNNVPLAITDGPRPYEKTHVPDPVVVEPVLTSVLGNSFLSPLVRLVKTHPRMPFLILAGFLVIAIAIILGVVLSRPNGPIIGLPDVKDATNGEQKLGQDGGDPFWRRIMWYVLIIGGIGIVLIIVAFVATYKPQSAIQANIADRPVPVNRKVKIVDRPAPVPLKRDHFLANIASVLVQPPVKVEDPSIPPAPM